LTILEKGLEKLDRDEVARLSLGSCRADNNEKRRAVLAEVDDALTDYGTNKHCPSEAFRKLTNLTMLQTHS
jgi:hypothetical protein